MFCNNTRLSFFAGQKDAARAGAALKKVAPALGSGQIRNRLRLHPKSGGSDSATLVFGARASRSWAFMGAAGADIFLPGARAEKILSGAGAEEKWLGSSTLNNGLDC